MGDRVSISFKNGDQESVALFSHWGGMEFVKHARNYADNLVWSRKERVDPLGRLEPETVMVDFISRYTRGTEVKSNLYLGKNKEDGDNCDNGHHVIDLGKIAELKEAMLEEEE